MARVTATEVKGIIETTLTDVEVDVYITSANTMVNAVLGTGTSDIFKEIERWLTAHMIAISRERQARTEEAGGARISYTGSYGDLLASTTYGQQVLMLDTSGKFGTLGKRRAQIIAIKSFE